LRAGEAFAGVIEIFSPKAPTTLAIVWKLGLPSGASARERPARVIRGNDMWFAGEPCLSAEAGANSQ
jgi:hypothetical protein